MASAEKRKADAGGDGSRKKVKKGWTVPRKGENADQAISRARREIEPSDVGIWATCNKGKEGKCVAELNDLFNEYAGRLYTIDKASDGNKASKSDHDDVDDEIERELNELRKPETKPLFTSIRLDTPCLIFFKVTDPVEPVSFVHRICKDASESTARKQSRSVKRLTPMTLTGKATEADLAKVAQQVLAPHFHNPPVSAKKFAIRPNIRNHHVLNRDTVIKQVAEIVGPGHTVDLKSYDLLILVEIYKNICGVSVVGSDFEELKRYNLAEIYEPTPKPPPPSEPASAAAIEAAKD